jgi:hypothetical protein
LADAHYPSNVINRREKDAKQDADDQNHHDQFDQCECGAGVWGPLRRAIDRTLPVRGARKSLERGSRGGDLARTGPASVPLKSVQRTLHDLRRPK